MIKLTHQQANELLGKVFKKRNICPSYRLGQGIFNLLPDDLAEYIRDTNDFFYWTDEDKVLEVFYAECVEG